MELDLKKLMETTPQSLAYLQREALVSHAKDILDKVYAAISAGDTKAMEKLVFDSPAGDETGEDNVCINFSYTPNDVMDIGDLTNCICDLDMIINSQRLK